jgi:hypothetical protein
MRSSPPQAIALAGMSGREIRDRTRALRARDPPKVPRK